jgi:NADH:ubiquinone oxidoreductase subunit K
MLLYNFNILNPFYFFLNLATIDIIEWFFIALLLIFFGFCGLLLQNNNMIQLLYCLELLLLGIQLFYISTVLFYCNFESIIYVLVLLVFAASETVIFISILILGLQNLYELHIIFLKNLKG